MNPEQFILMMNELPDSVIESANLPHSLPEQKRMRAVSSAPNAAAGQDAGDLPAANAKAERISVPRWTVAAVLAACMLFAVGTGAFLLHSDRDDLTVQSSQAEPAVPEVTGSITTAPTGTAKPVTTQRTDRTDITTTGTVTTQTAATADAVTEPPHSETESAEQTATETTAPQTTALPQTTEPVPSATEPETTTAAAVTTTEPRAPHKIMQMNSVEEVEREGNRMVGEYLRRNAELNGEIDENAPRITTEEVVQMLDDGMDFRAVLLRLHELYPYPDYTGGSGVTNTEYWLDNSGTDFILLTYEYESIVHIVQHADRTADVYDILTKRG